MKRKYLKSGLILAVFTMITSCSVSEIPLNNSNQNSIISNKLQTSNKNIVGKVEFPDFSKEQFKTKATLVQVAPEATVSLILPHDHPTKPNTTVTTGLTNSNGNFTLELEANVEFNPSMDDVFILEATKRIGGATNSLMAVRSFIQWKGNYWIGMTSPSLYINTKTTALSIISDLNSSSVTPASTIGTIDVSTGTSLPSTIGSTTSTTILNVSSLVTSVLAQNEDPVRYINFNNGEYFIENPQSPTASILANTKSCPDCDLRGEDLTNLDLTNGNITGANITNADFTGSDLTGMHWIDYSFCGSGSIGECKSEFSANIYTISVQENPTIIKDANGNFITSWESFQDGGGRGIYFQRFNSNGAKIGGEIQVNTTTQNDQKYPSIATDSTGKFLIVWQSYLQDGQGQGVFGQLYTSDGDALGTEFQVNTYVTGDQQKPVAAMDNSGNFAVAWQGYGQFDTEGIYVQRFDSATTKVGNEVLVNTYTTSAQESPAIGMDSSGNFIISWSGSGSDDVHGVYAQRFDSTGAKISTNFLINEYTTNNQQYPYISMNGSGNFVITWQSDGQDGNNYGIYAKRFSSSGSALSSEFKVNTYTTGLQENSAASIDSTGAFVITWQSFGQDLASTYGVYGQRYSSTGAIVGNEYQINTYTTNNQRNAVPSMLDSNNVFVIWDSLQDGSSYGIYLKKYQY